MKKYFFKPEFNNLTQGERLRFVRELRYMPKPYVAEHFQLGGDKPTDSIDKYERNAREPLPGRLKALAELYDVSINAIKKYDFIDPVDVIYYHMWEEELIPYSEFVFDLGGLKGMFYTENILKGIAKWQEMREKRENGEISDQDYIEWKLHFDLENIE